MIDNCKCKRNFICCTTCPLQYFKLNLCSVPGVDLENDIYAQFSVSPQTGLKISYLTKFLHVQPNFNMHRAKVTCICACKTPLNQALFCSYSGKVVVKRINLFFGRVIHVNCKLNDFASSHTYNIVKSKLDLFVLEHNLRHLFLVARQDGVLFSSCDRLLFRPIV